MNQELLKTPKPIAVPLVGSGIWITSLFLIMTTIGCGDSLKTNYGSTRGQFARESINGLSAFREMFETYGWKVRDQSRLSERLNVSQTLIWIPKQPVVLEEEQQDWFDYWLTEESNRTVIVIHPGYDATLDYWTKARSVAPPEQRMEYRRRRAQVLAEQLQNGPTGNQVGEWYSLKQLPAYTKTEIAEIDFDGDPEPSETEGSPLPKNWEIDSVLEEGTIAPEDQAEWMTIPDFTPVVVDSDDQVLAARLECDHWDGSKMLVIANAAPLVNFSLIEEPNRVFAGKIIEACGVPGRVTFLETVDALPISDAAEGPPRPSGMELFTQWPLNVLTMHFTIIGLLLLLAIAPIFGRPKQRVHASRTDFGRHLTAVAELLHRSGDVGFAKRKISDYFVQVRREPESSWVLPVSLSPSGTERTSPLKENPLERAREPVAEATPKST